MKPIVYLLLLILSFPAHSKTFNFWVQSIYTDEITINKVKDVFHDFDNAVNVDVKFNASSSAGKLISNHQNADLIIWGNSDKFYETMQGYGFNKILFSNIQVFLFKYYLSTIPPKSSIKIGVLKLSTAHHISFNYYQSLNLPSEFIEFNNYHSALSALYKGEIDYIAAAKSLPAGLSNASLKTIERVLTFPKSGKITVMINNDNAILRKEIVNYFTSKSEYIGNNFGTGDFVEVEN